MAQEERNLNGCSSTQSSCTVRKTPNRYGKVQHHLLDGVVLIAKNSKMA